MPMAYAIRNWALHYERGHKETEVAFRWVGMPTKHDGKGYRRLARHPDSIGVFLAFFLMVQIAGKLRTRLPDERYWRRGILADETGPLDADDLADETSYPTVIFQKAFKVLTDPKIGWLEVVEIPTSSDLFGRSPPTEQDSTEQDRTRSKPPSTEASVSTPSTASQTAPASGDDSEIVLTFPTKAGKKNKTREWQLRQAYLDELQQGFPYIDVRGESFKACAHVRSSPENLHTFDGMKRFLVRWMARTDRWRLQRIEAGQGRNGEPIGVGRTTAFPSAQERRLSAAEAAIASVPDLRAQNGGHR